MSTPTRLRHSPQVRIVQNFRLVWLDASAVDINDNNHCENIARLRRSITTVDAFFDTDQYVQFLGDINHEIVFLIVSGYVGKQLVPIVHDMTQLDSIYVLCGNATSHKQWTKQWLEIKGLFTHMSSICSELEKTAHQCDQA